MIQSDLKISRYMKWKVEVGTQNELTESDRLNVEELPLPAPKPLAIVDLSRPYT